VQQHHIGVFGANFVECSADGFVIVAVGAASEGDAGTGGSEQLGVGAAAGGDKFPAVNQ